MFDKMMCGIAIVMFAFSIAIGVLSTNPPIIAYYVIALWGFNAILSVNILQDNEAKLLEGIENA